jgi:AraC-like DNA-binding protein
VARFRVETCEGLCDYALSVAEGPTDTRGPEELCALLTEGAAALEAREFELPARSLQAVCRWLSGRLATPAGLNAQRQELKWLHDKGLTVAEEMLRIDTALALLSLDDGVHAAEVLGLLSQSEQAAQRHRHSLELKYCTSRLHTLAGRQGEALVSYKDYAKEALYRSTRERALLPHSRFLEKTEMAEHADSAMLRLPLRYRNAYRFIIARLDDRGLSIKQVAAHIDVTERALQMAFRTYLGMTPAQVIRHHRMEAIRNELRDSAGRSSVLKTAARWGLGNRSTLAHNYRQQFAETPTATLRGSI